MVLHAAVIRDDEAQEFVVAVAIDCQVVDQVSQTNAPSGGGSETCRRRRSVTKRANA